MNRVAKREALRQIGRTLGDAYLGLLEVMNNLQEVASGIEEGDVVEPEVVDEIADAITSLEKVSVWLNDLSRSF